MILFVLTPTVAACVLTEVAMGGALSVTGFFPEQPSSLVLFVEPDPHCQIENDADWTLRIQQQLHSALASHTVPDHVVIIGEVPITSHGE